MELYNAKRPAGVGLAESQSTLGFAVNKPQVPVPQFGNIERSMTDQKPYCQSQHETTESLLSVHTLSKLRSFRYCHERSSAPASEAALGHKDTTSLQTSNEDSEEHVQSAQARVENASCPVQENESPVSCYVPSYQVPSHENSPGHQPLNDEMHVIESQTHPVVTGPSHITSLRPDYLDDNSDDTRFYSFCDDVSVLACMPTEFSDVTDGLYEGIDDAILTALLDNTGPMGFQDQNSAAHMTTPKQSPGRRCEKSLSRSQSFSQAAEEVDSSDTFSYRNPATQIYPEWSGVSNGVENPYRSPEVLVSQPVKKSLPCENEIRKHQPPGKSSPVRPFMRPPFPAGVPEKSPVQGLSSRYMVLRTCFRISEAFRVSLSRASQRSKGSDATSSRSKTPVPLIELYAFVEGSYRSGHRQYFRFVDLFFPSKPPYLSGVWEEWSNNPVFEQCGRDFLGAGGREWVYQSKNPEQVNQRRMCRVIGILTTKAESLNFEGYTRFSETSFLSPQPIHETFLINIRSIQTATWSDVIYTKGIVIL